MDNNPSPKPPHATPEPSQLQSLSTFVAHNITRKLLELAEIDAARYYALTKRHEMRCALPPTENEMTLIGLAAERVKTRMEDARNTASEYELDIEQVVKDGEYPHLVRFEVTRKGKAR